MGLSSGLIQAIVELKAADGMRVKMIVATQAMFFISILDLSREL
jgi:hypothetical protein